MVNYGDFGILWYIMARYACSLSHLDDLGHHGSLSFDCLNADLKSTLHAARDSKCRSAASVSSAAGRLHLGII